MFRKKAARVGYTNIISSLSLRLASVPPLLSNSARRNCTRLVVNRHYIFNILLVRVVRGTYVRTMHINIRHPAEVLVAVCYYLLLEVVDTFSHEADFVVLNSVYKISFHIVFVLVVVIPFRAVIYITDVIMVLVAPPSGLILTRQRPSLLSCAFANFLVVCHCCVCFLFYAAKVLFFFDMCKFLVQKNVFFVSFFQYVTHKRKNTTRKHAQKTRRAIAARRGNT